jgi:hypothetical protein
MKYIYIYTKPTHIQNPLTYLKFIPYRYTHTIGWFPRAVLGTR